MRLFPRAALLASLRGTMADVAPSKGVVEVDLVFPRNETYAPTALLPVVFAIQNPGLAEPLGASLHITISNATENENASWIGPDHKYDHIYVFDLGGSNFSSQDPHFEHRYFKEFDIERAWKLEWYMRWTSCNVSEETQDPAALESAHGVRDHQGGWGTIYFTTAASAPAVDLAASINDNCPEGSDDFAFALNITGTLPIDSGGSCPVTDFSTAQPSPCRVKADSGVLSSIAAQKTDSACLWSGWRPGKTPVNTGFQLPEGIDCDKGEDKSAAQRLTGGGKAWVATALGTLVYLLVV